MWKSDEYPSRVYIAGPFEACETLGNIKAVISTLPGYEVVSTWTDNDKIGPSEGSSAADEVAKAYAVKDVEELLDADLLLLDTIETNDRGGKDFESGLAHGNGIEWWVIGPYRNVFQRLADAHYETWDEAIEALKARG